MSNKKNTTSENTSENDTEYSTENNMEYLFDRDEEDTLFDAWMMLRHAGLSETTLAPMTEVIEQETRYEKETLTRYYNNRVRTE